MLAELLRFDIDNFLHKCGQVVPGQVVDVVVPVVSMAVLLPLGKFAGVDAAEVTHEDIIAKLRSHVGKAVGFAVDDPSLCGV